MSLRPFAAAILVASAAAIAAPILVGAQTAPYSQVIITTQVAPGTSVPTIAPTVIVSATSPVMNGVINTQGGMLSYTSNFNNEVHAVNFIPGSYTISANAPGYFFTYSNDCMGFTPLGGATRTCVITLSTTPPPSQNPCTAPYYGSGSCSQPVLPYTGPITPSVLTCSPATQTVPVNQPATFKATGGTGAVYNWTTPDRTFLNTSGTLSTVFQSTGTQTVVVSSGVQSATCTVTIGPAGAVAIAPAAPVSYPGSPSVTVSYVPSGNPVSVSNPSYTPAGLPNTGYGPMDSAALAFSLVLLMAAGIIVAPYVRQTFAIALS